MSALLAQRREAIEAVYSERLHLTGTRQTDIAAVADSLDSEETLAFRFLCATAPLSDLAGPYVSELANFARHGVHLWRNGPFAGRISDDLFANYVLYHRVNDEGLSYNRATFHAKLIDNVAGKSLSEAALTVNYWCAEHVTYRVTDNRTAAPLAVYKSGFGRCGEESVFAVSALRSVGIPARQVYAPRWSHCDDNHAWVEVWCGDGWHYLGACEPEEILDRGWFTGSAAKAMLIHSRWFDFAPPEDEVTEIQGCVRLCNQLHRYARTAPLVVVVQDVDGTLLQGVLVDFQVLNFAQLVTIAALVTGPDGTVRLTAGLGSLHLHAQLDGWVANTTVNVADCGCVTLTLAPPAAHDWRAFDLLVAVPQRDDGPRPTPQQVAVTASRLAAAQNKREARAATFCPDGQLAELLCGSPNPAALLVLLEQSGANFSELRRFLLNRATAPHRARKEQLLGSLSQKDLRDVTAALLLSHLEAVLPYADTVPDDIFVPYILCPRIANEPLTAFRAPLLARFGPWSRVYRREPLVLYLDITAAIHVAPEQEYPPLTTAPAGLLAVGAGSALSQQLLFVAACRTLGIPARLSPNGTIQVYTGGEFQHLFPYSTATLTLTAGKDNMLNHQSWSLAMLEEDAYHDLDLTAVPWRDGVLTLTLPVGYYRLVTVNRMFSGDQLANYLGFTLAPHEQLTIPLVLRQAALAEMLAHLPLSDFFLRTPAGESSSAVQLAGEDPAVFLWLEIGREPTEHLLNELLDSRMAFAALGERVHLIVRKERDVFDPTLAVVRAALPAARVLLDATPANRQAVARTMSVDGDLAPLILVAAPELIGVYAASGYQVGTGELLLRVMAAL